jgi:hypothetical protein
MVLPPAAGAAGMNVQLPLAFTLYARDTNADEIGKE